MTSSSLVELSGARARGSRPRRRLARIAWVGVLLTLLGLSSWRYLSELPLASPVRSAPVAEPGSFAGPTMGTWYQVKLGQVDLDRAARTRVQRVIEDTLQRIDRRMSTYRTDSELSRFNAATRSAPISGETIGVIRQALQVSRLTRGAFDVTVAPLVDAWGFGPKAAPHEIPDTVELARIQQFVGHRLLVLDEERGTLSKLDPRVRCDLSAIAKGYAVDAVGDALQHLGYTDYLVEVGGEVRANGRNPAGEIWLVGIERPDPTRRASALTLRLDGQGVATSGSYRNFRQVQQQILSHTIDPRTARPVSHSLVSVSVVHESVMIADALATALQVLGPHHGYQLASEEQLAAWFVTIDTDGRLTSRSTPAFAELVDSPAGPEWSSANSDYAPGAGLAP